MQNIVSRAARATSLKKCISKNCIRASTFEKKNTREGLHFLMAKVAKPGRVVQILSVAMGNIWSDNPHP